jgi:hypothetical protein
VRYQTTARDLPQLLDPAAPPKPRAPWARWAVVRVHADEFGLDRLAVVSWHRTELRATEYRAVYTRRRQFPGVRLGLLHVRADGDAE